MTTGQKRISINRDIDASMKRLVTVQRMNDFMDDALPVVTVAVRHIPNVQDQNSISSLVKKERKIPVVKKEYRLST